ncbi:MAG: Gfo/Idh/MocA family oxidoreductase [Rectinemataceae bacterium]|jgi:predicted dehydrogenase
MKHKVLLLGLGFWGIRWLELIERTGRCELAGVAGSQEEIERACTQFGVAKSKAFLDYREAIAATDASIAIIVIPAILHADAAKLALGKGLNIIVEKPLAMSMGEARELLSAKAANPSLKFMTSQNYRWRPHTQAIKRALAGGILGGVESLSLEFRKQEDLQGYRAGLEKPLLQDVCIHHFDLIRFFTGSDCQEIFCRTYRPRWSEFVGEPNVDAVMKMRNGVSVNYCGTWAARGMESSWDGNITITGEKGCLKLRADDTVTFYEHKKSAIVSFDPSIQEGILIEKPDMRFTEMEFGFHMFMDCVEQDRVPETTIEDNFNSYSMVAGALDSAKNNRPSECQR